MRKTRILAALMATTMTLTALPLTMAPAFAVNDAGEEHLPTGVTVSLTNKYFEDFEVAPYALSSGVAFVTELDGGNNVVVMGTAKENDSYYSWGGFGRKVVVGADTLSYPQSKDGTYCVSFDIRRTSEVEDGTGVSVVTGKTYDGGNTNVNTAVFFSELELNKWYTVTYIREGKTLTYTKCVSKDGSHTVDDAVKDASAHTVWTTPNGTMNFIGYNPTKSNTAIPAGYNGYEIDNIGFSIYVPPVTAIKLTVGDSDTLTYDYKGTVASYALSVKDSNDYIVDDKLACTMEINGGEPIAIPSDYSFDPYTWGITNTATVKFTATYDGQFTDSVTKNIVVENVPYEVYTEDFEDGNVFGLTSAANTNGDSVLAVESNTVFNSDLSGKKYTTISFVGGEKYGVPAEGENGAFKYPKMADGTTKEGTPYFISFDFKRTSEWNPYAMFAMQIGDDLTLEEKGESHKYDPAYRVATTIKPSKLEADKWYTVTFRVDPVYNATKVNAVTIIEKGTTNMVPEADGGTVGTWTGNFMKDFLGFLHYNPTPIAGDPVLGNYQLDNIKLSYYYEDIELVVSSEELSFDYNEKIVPVDISFTVTDLDGIDVTAASTYTMQIGNGAKTEITNDYAFDPYALGITESTTVTFEASYVDTTGTLTSSETVEVSIRNTPSVSEEIPFELDSPYISVAQDSARPDYFQIAYPSDAEYVPNQSAAADAAAGMIENDKDIGAQMGRGGFLYPDEVESYEISFDFKADGNWDADSVLEIQSGKSKMDQTAIRIKGINNLTVGEWYKFTYSVNESGLANCRLVDANGSAIAANGQLYTDLIQVDQLSAAFNSSAHDSVLFSVKNTTKTSGTLGNSTNSYSLDNVTFAYTPKESGGSVSGGMFLMLLMKKKAATAGGVIPEKIPATPAYLAHTGRESSYNAITITGTNPEGFVAGEEYTVELKWRTANSNWANTEGFEQLLPNPRVVFQILDSSAGEYMVSTDTCNPRYTANAQAMDWSYVDDKGNPKAGLNMNLDKSVGYAAYTDEWTKAKLTFVIASTNGQYTATTVAAEDTKFKINLRVSYSGVTDTPEYTGDIQIDEVVFYKTKDKMKVNLIDGSNGSVVGFGDGKVPASITVDKGSAKVVDPSIEA